MPYDDYDDFGSYDNYQHDGGGAYEGVKDDKAKKFLSSATDTVNNPTSSQDKGQDSLWSWATKKTGLDLTSLPKLRVTTKPGMWAKWTKWKTSALKSIARKAKKSAPTVVFTPKKYRLAIKSMLINIKATKRNLDAAKPLAERQGGAAAQTYRKLSLRWYEAASGLLRSAVYKKSGDDVRLGLDINLYPVRHKGVSFTAFNAAFAYDGGKKYAAALKRDSAALLASLKSPSSVVKRASTDVLETAKEGGAGGVVVVGLGLIIGIAVIKKLRG
jgi:hypothetical protein